jgi:hypothetical protein
VQSTIDGTVTRRTGTESSVSSTKSNSEETLHIRPHFGTPFDLMTSNDSEQHSWLAEGVAYFKQRANEKLGQTAPGQVAVYTAAELKTDLNRFRRCSTMNHDDGVAKKQWQLAGGRVRLGRIDSA